MEAIALDAVSSVATSTATTLAADIVGDGIEIIEEKENKTKSFITKLIVLCFIFIFLFLIRFYIKNKK